MNWRGRLWGGTFGFLFGGPLGALVGMAVGQRMDDSLQRLFGLAGAARSQTAFFAATFLLMGHLAKLNGRVDKAQIAAARLVMERMNLNASQRRVAIRLFRAGKSPEFPFETFLIWLGRELTGRQDLVRSFLEIQWEVARTGAGPLDTRRRRLQRVCEKLGFPLDEFDRLAGDGLCRGQISVDEAYQVLGLSHQASGAEIRLAYRRLVSRHHPDRLAAAATDLEVLRQANERTGRIVAAYERLRQVREF